MSKKEFKPDNFNPQPKKDLDNELLRVASEQGLIDINNTEALEKGFTTFFTSEEIQKIKHVNTYL